MSGGKDSKTNHCTRGPKDLPSFAPSTSTAALPLVFIS